MAGSYLIAHKDTRRKTTGRDPDETVETSSTFAAGSPCRVRWGTRHADRITKKFYVCIVFTSVASLELDRQTSQIQIQHY